MRYRHGLFLPVPGITSLEEFAQEQGDDERFLAAVDQAEQQGRHVSDSINANNYAPASFSKTAGITVGQAWPSKYASGFPEPAPLVSGDKGPGEDDPSRRERR